MEDITENHLAELRAVQTRLSNKLYFLAFKTIFIFGVPAILGYFVGVYLEKNGMTKALAYAIPLTTTFVFSWYVLLRKLKGLKREVEKVEVEIRRLAPPVVKENEDEDDENRHLK